jgi:hypothetical protein
MLDVKKADGSIEIFHYAWLSRVKYQPGDTLVLRFGRNEINIEGRNLSRTGARYGERDLHCHCRG